MKYVENIDNFLIERAYVIEGVREVINVIKDVRNELLNKSKSHNFISSILFNNLLNKKVNNIKFYSNTDSRIYSTISFKIELLRSYKPNTFNKGGMDNFNNILGNFTPIVNAHFNRIDGNIYVLHTLDAKQFFLESSDKIFNNYLNILSSTIEHELIHFNQATNGENIKDILKKYTNNNYKSNVQYYGDIDEVEAGANTAIYELYNNGYTKDEIKKHIQSAKKGKNIKINSDKFNQIKKYTNKELFNYFLICMEEYLDIIDFKSYEEIYNEFINFIHENIDNKDFIYDIFNEYDLTNDEIDFILNINENWLSDKFSSVKNGIVRKVLYNKELFKKSPKVFFYSIFDKIWKSIFLWKAGIITYVCIALNLSLFTTISVVVLTLYTMYKFIILGYAIKYGKDLLNIGLITINNKLYLNKLKILFPNTAKSIEKVHLHIYSIFDKNEIVKIENLILRDSKLITLQKKLSKETDNIKKIKDDYNNYLKSKLTEIELEKYNKLVDLINNDNEITLNDKNIFNIKM